MRRVQHVGVDEALSASLEFEVTEADTAASLLSGELAVLATPRLVAWMEAATCAAVADGLGERQTTVGTRVAIDHRSASAIGDSVRTTATLTGVEGQVLTFEVVATDLATGRLLGDGAITRAMVDRRKFMARFDHDPPAPR